MTYDLVREAGMKSAVGSPVIVEGRPWGNPVKRMRDYVTLLRQGFAGQPVDDEVHRPTPG